MVLLFKYKKKTCKRGGGGGILLLFKALPAKNKHDRKVGYQTTH